MKRLLSIIVGISLVLLVANANGDSFSYRGVDFSMTSSQIRAAETLNLTNGKENGGFMTFKGTVDDIKSSTVEYHFNNGKLIDIWVSYGAQQSTLESDYRKINSILETQYGKPLGNKNGKTSSYIGSAFKTVITMNTQFAEMTKKSYRRAYDEWIVVTNDGLVKIDHMYFYSKAVRSPVCVHEVQYTFFSK